MFFAKIALVLAASASLSAAVRAAPTTAADQLAALRALAGSWDVSDADGPAGTASYEVVAAGSVVVETLFGMVTTYYVDGARLVAVHYCSAHNEPHYAVTPGSTATSLRFETESVQNLPTPETGYMARLSLELGAAGADRFTQAWTFRHDGVEDAPMVLTYARHVP